jgi:hypothetical protein
LILSNRKRVYLEKKRGAVKNVDGIPREIDGKLMGKSREISGVISVVFGRE